MNCNCVKAEGLRYQKISSRAFAPYRATEFSAGFDLTATSKEVGDNYIKYGTGLILAIPVGHVGLLFPRSSIYKTGLQLCNCVGVIDSDYRGEVMAVFRKSISHNQIYDVGDRIVQLVIMKLPEINLFEVDSLDETERSAGGFGSTGK